MVCKYCGKEIADNSVICPACGKRLVKSSLWSQTYKLNEIPKRYYLCALALLVSGIISLLSFLLLMKNDAYTLKENVITFEQDGESTVFYFDDWQLDSENGVLVDEEHMGISFTGGTFAFFDANSVEQGGDGSVYSVATLYYANNKGVHKVADKVRDFRLSPMGKYIVYIDSVQELQLYDCQKQTKTEIDHNVLINNLCVADDGSIAYLKKESDGEYMFVYRGGKCVEYEESDRAPISVVNGGKRFYMIDSAHNLYYHNGTSELKIAADVTDCWFDEKSTDIFYHSEGKSYIYTGSSDPHEISEDSLALVLCDDTAEYVSGGIVHYGIADFAKKYYTDSEGKLFYVNGKYEAEQIAEDIHLASVKSSIDGKSVVYISEGKLYFHQSSADEPTEMAEDVIDFVITDDARHIYYTDDDGVLYAKYGKKDAEKVGEDVLEFDITAKKYVFFVTSDDDGYELYAVKGTGDAKSICDGLEKMPEFNHSMVKYIEDDDVYTSRGDLNFKER